MSATAQADLGFYNHDQDILSAIVKVVKANKKWNGTSTELVKVLGLDMSARSLSVQLKKLNDKIEKSGISISWDRKRDKRIIVISNSAVVSPNEVSLRHTIQSPHLDSGFASHTEKEVITLPFEWKYATITALTEEEISNINRLRNQGRKRYQKPCSLCGEEGHIKFRKISDGNSSLICKPCAENYIRSAKRIMLQIENV